MEAAMADIVNRHLTISHASPSLARLRVASVLLLHGIADLLATWRQRSRSRIQLAQLNDRDLLDLGISRVDGYRETSKPFWRD
jgi:uncharacterized protein YjiS (DUF1127 family)